MPVDDRSGVATTEESSAARVRAAGDEPRLQEALATLRAEARRLWLRLGRCVELEELEALAHPKLVELLRHYDPRLAPFAAYATLKLRWAMVDGVRRLTHGRTAAGRARALGGSERLAAADRENPAAVDGLQEDESQARSRLRAMLRAQAAVMAVGLIGAHADVAGAVDPGESPEEVAVRRDAARQLRGLVRDLPGPERELVEQHYFGDQRFDHVAAGLGISKSWASRLHRRAIRMLAAKVREAAPDLR